MLPQKQPLFLPGRLTIEAGGPADYRTLARFHYVAARPATCTAVVAARWRPDGGPGRVVGVAVLSHPSALNRTRHRVFGLKPLPFGVRLRWVNAHLRTVSRVIVHPQFRGLGLSTRLIAALCDECPTPFVEACARMGRAHPLFERAGFRRAEVLLPSPPSAEWARKASKPFRDYFTAVATAKESFLKTVAEDAFEYVANVRSTVPLTEAEAIEEEAEADD